MSLDDPLLFVWQRHSWFRQFYVMFLFVSETIAYGAWAYLLWLILEMRRSA